MKGMKTRPTPPIPYKLFLIAPRTRIKLRRQIGKVGLRKKPHCFKNVVQIDHHNVVIKLQPATELLLAHRQHPQHSKCLAR